MGRLIFIEGVSGVGKSTMAAALVQALSAQGHKAAGHLEGDPNSPLDLFCCAYLSKEEFRGILSSYPGHADALAANSIVEADYAIVRYQTGRERLYPEALHNLLKRREFCYQPSSPIPFCRYRDVFLSLWQRFADDPGSADGNHIFDGSFLHHQVNDLLRNYRLPDGAVMAYLSRLLATLKPLNPVLFYLASDDVRDRLVKARKARNQKAPTDTAILFWENRKRIDQLALACLDIKPYVLDVGDGMWDRALHAAMEVLLRL